MLIEVQHPTAFTTAASPKGTSPADIIYGARKIEAR
jgi:hypothetical protein